MNFKGLSDHWIIHQVFKVNTDMSCSLPIQISSNVVTIKNRKAILKLPCVHTVPMDHSPCISVPHYFHDISNKLTTKRRVASSRFLHHLLIAEYTCCQETRGDTPGFDAVFFQKATPC